MIEQLNLYAKDLLLKLAFRYKDDLGIRKSQFLYYLVNEDLIVLDDKKSANLLNFENDQKMHLYQNSKAYQTLSSNEKELLETIKNAMIPEFFRLIINPTPEEEMTPEFQEFYHFLTDGFIEYFADSFSKEAKLEYQINPANENKLEFVTQMLRFLPEEVSKEKTIFQYQYPYILELCQIASENMKPYGINFYSNYEKNYKKDNRKLEEIHYENMKELLKNTLPSAKNKEIKIDNLLQKYRLVGTVEYARQDLKKIYTKSYGNNPDSLERIYKEIDSVFEHTNAGQKKNSENTRVLAPTGFLKGSIVVILSIVLGIILSIIILQ